MSINCSEKCLYEDDGLCTLNRVISSSGNISSGCPYYKGKNESNENRENTFNDLK